jgi:hypothetical protein
MHDLMALVRPKELAFASLLTIEDVTFVNPEPTLTDADLFAPGSAGDRLRVSPNPADWRPNWFDARSDRGDDPATRHVVMVVVGPDYNSLKLYLDELSPCVFFFVFESGPTSDHVHLRSG